MSTTTHRYTMAHRHALDQEPRIRRAPSPPERSCYTCRHSPPAPTPGCAALVVGDEGDPTHDAIVDYCERSGVNDEDSATPGFPTDRRIACPVWERR